MKNIEVGEISSEIIKFLESENENIKVKALNIIETTAKETCKSLKNDSTIPKQTGKYKKSFYIKKSGEGYVVANRCYHLTHLLEKGHETRNGGRARAFPHWAKAEKQAEQIIENKLKDI